MPFRDLMVMVACVASPFLVAIFIWFVLMFLSPDDEETESDSETHPSPYYRGEKK